MVTEQAVLIPCGKKQYIIDYVEHKYIGEQIAWLATIYYADMVSGLT